MPHIVIEHTTNLPKDVDISKVAQVIHRRAVISGIFPVGGVRTLLRPAQEFYVGNEHPANAFILITIKIMPGRSVELRQSIVSILFEAATDELNEALNSGSVALQLELTEIDSTMMRQINPMLE